MLSEKDKQNLFGGKRGILIIFPKQKALNRLNALITEADNILDTYKEVVFDNVFQTAFLQNSRILFEEQMWSQAVDNSLSELFNNEQSDIRQRLNSVISQDAISDYANTRNRLIEKRNILVALRDDIKEL